MRIAIFLLMLAPLLAQAETYKCVDSRGKIFYTDKPQRGCEADPRGGGKGTSKALRSQDRVRSVEAQRARDRECKRAVEEYHGLDGGGDPARREKLRSAALGCS